MRYSTVTARMKPQHKKSGEPSVSRLSLTVASVGGAPEGEHLNDHYSICSARFGQIAEKDGTASALKYYTMVPSWFLTGSGRKRPRVI